MLEIKDFSEKQKEMAGKVIIPLDFSTMSKVTEIVDIFSPFGCYFKTGLQVITSFGLPTIVQELKNRKAKIFGDLKLLDIPNTVEEATRAASALGLDMLNLHALGGLKMMLAAKKAVDEFTNPPILLGVTILTSLDKEAMDEMDIFDKDLSVQKTVIRLAYQVKDAKLNGVIASAQEAKEIRKAIGPNFLIVTPSIRPLYSIKPDDQKRPTTPGEAISSGADYLVIGRPLYNPPDGMTPLEALFEITKEMAAI